jgi:hypothetical protein
MLIRFCSSINSCGKYKDVEEGVGREGKGGESEGLRNYPQLTLVKESYSHQFGGQEK